MADYYPLLAKAVSGLKNSTPETRGVIYERARKALLGQLRAMQPPAPESAIEREARALDDAIARVEIEAAARVGADAEEANASLKPALDEEPAPQKMPASEERPEPDSAGPEPVEAREAPPIPPPPVSEGDEEKGLDDIEVETPGREALRPAAPKPPARTRGGLRRLAILTGVLAAVVALVAFAAWKLRDKPEDLAKLAPPPESAEQTSGGKIGQRIGENGAASPASAPASPAPAPPPAPAPTVPIAYRAAILMQAPNEPGGVKTYVGTVVWRRDSVNRGPNQQLSSAIRADVDLPEAGMKATMTIEKNYEPTLSASHTLSVHFDPAPDSPIGDVRAMNVPEMRRDDAPRGSPLQGMQVDVAPNVFLVGLYSAGETQNVDMIRSLNWIDIPMSLANGKIAKMTFEKGAAGAQIIDDVFNEWKSAAR